MGKVYVLVFSDERIRPVKKTNSTLPLSFFYCLNFPSAFSGKRSSTPVSEIEVFVPTYTHFLRTDHINRCSANRSMFGVREKMVRTRFQNNRIHYT